jgi:predicted phosphoribosyltransferase
MDEIQLPYKDRRQAGRLLAARLEAWRGSSNLLVLALPRGGVPVAAEVAHELQAPLDIFVVRKLGYPGHEEYAMGAIASGGVRVMNPLDGMEVPADAIAAVVAREQDELQRREMLYRGERPAIALRGRDVIVVDDGLATGATMRAAVLAIRQHRPLRVTVAVPVGSSEACAALRAEADEVVCAATPVLFRAVGIWYRDFPQTTDEEVHRLLDEARREHATLAAHH